MTDLEKLIKKKIFFFKGTKINQWDVYKSFNKTHKLVHGAKSGELKLQKAHELVEYDSLIEKNVLLDLDKCNFIREIKTQSLEIPFKAKIGTKMHTYIPDVQLLFHGGAIVIIEIKPFKEMVNSTVLRKSKALREYCKKNGYGFSIIDKDYYSFEDLKKEVVPDDVQKKFISFVKEKEEVSFSECKNFKKDNNLTDKQICYIIWKNKKSIKYQQHKIMIK